MPGRRGDIEAEGEWVGLVGEYVVFDFAFDLDFDLLRSGILCIDALRRSLLRGGVALTGESAKSMKLSPFSSAWKEMGPEKLCLCLIALGHLSLFFSRKAL